MNYYKLTIRFELPKRDDSIMDNVVAMLLSSKYAKRFQTIECDPYTLEKVPARMVEKNRGSVVGYYNRALTNWRRRLDRIDRKRQKKVKA